jgi:decaprenylphospho-beta-D-ribofuranose 2-oxidase
MAEVVSADLRKSFVSFDGGVSCAALSSRPAELTLKGLSDIEEKALAGKQGRIARGAGLSFAAASFSEDAVSLELSSFREIIGYDREKGIIEVQAGATMGDIYNYLVDHGRYLVTQPGYPSITAGGCIAVDVHGKNQFRDGNFAQYVESIKLLHPAYGVIEASERFHKDVFELTLGGYGLTGNILSAKLKTKVLPAARMDLMVEPIEQLQDTPAMIEKAARGFDSTVSWHDFSAEGKAFGRGFLINGRYKKASTGQEKWVKLRQSKYVDSVNRAGLGLSFYSLPMVRLINVLYGGATRNQVQARDVPVYDCLYPSRYLRSFYYKMYGAGGFHESQLIVPVRLFEEFTAAIKQWLGQNPLPITLASAKFFEGKQELLRFAGKGVCFALNFPRCPEADKFLRFLDELCLRLQLLPYIAKDSRLPLAVVRACYPEYESFRERIKKFDPERLFCSEVSQRLEL